MKSKPKCFLNLKHILLLNRIQMKGKQNLIDFQSYTDKWFPNWFGDTLLSNKSALFSQKSEQFSELF